MANLAIRKIIALEKIYAEKKTAASALALAVRYYTGFAVSRQRDFLHKANFVLAAFSDSPDISLVFMRAHIAYEMGNIELLEELITGVRHQRNAMKNQDAALYAYYLYFNCITAIAKEKERAANKHYRALKDFCAENNPDKGYLLLAMANCAFKEYEDALAYLHFAQRSGDNSPFYYICLAEVMENAVPQGAQGMLLLPLVRWGLAQGYYLGEILAKNHRFMQEVLRKNPGDAEKLYREYPLDWVLDIVCVRRMIDNDLSEQAFYFYKEAETRQLYFQQLYDFLMRAAYKNGIENISRYSLAQYLKTEDIPAEILPFAYHLVLKTAWEGKNSDLLEKIKNDILAFACYAMENRLFGRYYYSLYRFLLDTALAKGGEKIDAKYVKTAEDTIKNLLFAYEITFDDGRVKKIIVGEASKQGEAVYDVKGGRVRVNLYNAKDVKITCFDETFRNIIESGFKLQKLVENVSTELLSHFFTGTEDSAEMLIALSVSCMAQANLDDMAAKVLQATISSKQAVAIAIDFRMQARVALGNFYAGRREFVKAVECYKGIDDAKIDPKFMEQMLLAYIHAGEIARATRLVSLTGGNISDKNLFHAVKRIVVNSSSEGGANLKTLAGLAYEQLVRGWYDRGLLGLVLERHTASLGQWIELAKSLGAMGAEEPALYSRILETAIQIRGISAGVQGIFAKMAEGSPDNEVLLDFAVYMSYEIIANGLLPEYAAIYALEGVFNKTGEQYVAYALAHVYIRDSIATANSASILSKAIEIAAENDIVWPIFKDIKDKNIIQPYIEESAPFLYRGRAGSTVSLYYRFGAEDDFVKQNMKPLRFGLFACHVPHFYGEELEYYFEEAMARGSITVPAAKITNNRPHVLEKSAELYYIINNALVYEQMFKYDNVEEIVTGRLAERPVVRAKIF